MRVQSHSFLGVTPQSIDTISLASQPYFSLFPVGGVRDKEKYGCLARLRYYITCIYAQRGSREGRVRRQFSAKNNQGTTSPL